jgi:putative resolvase
MKLSEWATQQGVHYQTAWRWWKRGTLPVPARQLASGTILVEVPTAPGAGGRTVVYARVSAHDQRADLDRQVSRAVRWSSAHRLAVDEVVTEVGSGLNGRRPKLARLLADPGATTIVVEHRDRLAR